MPDIAFIVEGQLEQRAVQAACPGRRVVLLGANGDDVRMETICDRIETQFRLFSNRYFPIVVIFDREWRNETVEELETVISSILVGRGLDPHQFIFFISDRKFECLFLAHLTHDGHTIPSGCPITNSIDGLDGVSEVRKRLAASGLRYHKTTTGVYLFRSIRPSIVALKSQNFRRFQSRILRFCPWAAL
jgi:hypothetical protein